MTKTQDYMIKKPCWGGYLTILNASSCPITSVTSFIGFFQLSYTCMTSSKSYPLARILFSYLNKIKPMGKQITDAGLYMIVVSGAMCVSYFFSQYYTINEYLIPINASGCPIKSMRSFLGFFQLSYACMTSSKSCYTQLPFS